MLRPSALTGLLGLALSASCTSSLPPSATVDAAPPVNEGEADTGEPQATWDARCALELTLDAELCAEIASLALPASLPPAYGNRHGDDIEAARLGFLIFYDARFAGLPEVRCATCHLPEQAFGDGRALAEVQPGVPLTRNTPTILNAAWAGPYFFWDGRADSLWSQPLFAFESAAEMASSRLRLAHALHEHPLYRAKYEQLFGALPELDDTARFPGEGKPGDARYDGMARDDQRAVDLVAANVGKALEAYMRKVSTRESALDRYLSGDPDALEPGARSGLRLFATRGCMACHGGPAMSDGAFHRTESAGPDRGRAGGIELLLENPFNAAGSYFDEENGARRPLPVAGSADEEGAFRTPTLRNVVRSAPYGHDGRYPTLDALLASGHGAQLRAEEQADLLLFLLALNGAYPERPWSDWPAR